MIPIMKQNVLTTKARTTLYTDEEQRREVESEERRYRRARVRRKKIQSREIQARRSGKKKDAVARNVRKVASPYVFSTELWVGRVQK